MRRLAPFLALSALASACSGHHDQLAAGGSGGHGGAAGAASDAGGSDASDEQDSDAATDGPADDEPGADADAAPALPSVLTLVNGLADAPAMRFCFATVAGGAEWIPATPPFPADPAGLPYASRLALSTFPGLDLATTTVHPYVIAGDLSLLGSQTCADLLAATPEPDSGSGPDAASDAEPDSAADAAPDGSSDASPDAAPPPEGIAIAPLPILPAGTLSAGKSYLLVATGCVGGPAHTASGDTTVCGQAYTPTTPTATLAVVALSRATQAGALGLQAVHASTYPAAANVHVAPAGGNGSSFAIADGIAPGVLAPKTATFSYQRQSFGPSPGDASLVFQDKSSTSPLAGIPLSQALANGGLSDADFQDGASFTFVAVGPHPGAGQGPWWSPFTFVVVPNEPAP